MPSRKRLGLTDHQNLTGAFYVGNGWEGNGIIVDSYYGSFPKIPCV